MNKSSSLIDRRAMLGFTAAAMTRAVTACTKAMAPVSSSAPEKRRFENEVVVITGATSGIGRAAAFAFAAEGGKVGFCGRRENLGRDVEQDIRSKAGEATYIHADVRIEGEVKAFVDQIAARYGHLDVAFNNAGITLEKPLHEYSSQEWDDVQSTNLRGVFLAMTYEIPHMLAGGGGNIVVTSSSNAIATTEKRSAYTASKRGLVGLVQSAALDYAQKNIRVNALIPAQPTQLSFVARPEWRVCRMPSGKLLPSSGQSPMCRGWRGWRPRKKLLRLPLFSRRTTTRI